MDDSKREIMEAVYAVLCREGYQELSIQSIADELDKGKSYIYHYYSDKEGLMNSFLDYVLERMRTASGSYSEHGPAERFDKMLDEVLAIQNREMKQFRTAVMEMKAQTPHNEEFTQVLKEKGVESPEVKAELLVSTVEGLMDRKIGYNSDENLEELKTELKSQILGGKH